jgi:hypothetical protein
MSQARVATVPGTLRIVFIVSFHLFGPHGAVAQAQVGGTAEVATAGELRTAIEAGLRFIVVTAHLDLSALEARDSLQSASDYTALDYYEVFNHHYEWHSDAADRLLTISPQTAAIVVRPLPRPHASPAAHCILFEQSSDGRPRASVVTFFALLL